MVTDRSRDDRPTINACPVCNFPDIGITQKCEYFALSKFPQVKSGEMTMDELLNPEGSEGVVFKKPIPEPVSKDKPIKLKLRPDAKHKKKPKRCYHKKGQTLMVIYSNNTIGIECDACKAFIHKRKVYPDGAIEFFRTRIGCSIHL